MAGAFFPIHTSFSWPCPGRISAASYTRCHRDGEIGSLSVQPMFGSAFASVLLVEQCQQPTDVRTQPRKDEEEWALNSCSGWPELSSYSASGTPRVVASEPW